MATAVSDVAMILCCECGIAIESNATALCASCLAGRVDITQEVSKSAVMQKCNGCDRYLIEQNKWIAAENESRELLQLCLRRLHGLNRVRLVDASFLWTEPHSKRLKVRVTIEKEVSPGAIVRQSFVAEYTVANLFCTDCHRVEAKDFWKALVQIRQRVAHKRTLFYFEQLLLRNDALHRRATRIETVVNGMDFYFANRQDARKLADFARDVLPSRSASISQRLVSHDTHSNVFNYKWTFTMDIVPICKDDVVCLTRAATSQHGLSSRLCVVLRINNRIQVIEPSTLRRVDITAAQYYATESTAVPFSTVCTARDLVRFTVLDVEERDVQAHAKRDNGPQMRAGSKRKRGPERLSESEVAPKAHAISGSMASLATTTSGTKFRVADCWLVRSDQLGKTDRQLHARTHLGHLLKCGDTVLGFDLTTCNVNNDSFEEMDRANLPDVIIVKKVYGDSETRRRKRRFKLRHLRTEGAPAAETNDRDYNQFLEELEEDAEMRKNVNLYIDRTKSEKPTAGQDGEEEEEDGPEIPLEELLDELNLKDKPEDAEQPLDAENDDDDDDDDEDHEPDTDMTAN